MGIDKSIIIATYGDSNNYSFEKYLISKGYVVRAKAVPGTQMKGICWSFVKDFFKVHADIYIIDGGGNDLQAGTQLKKTLRYFKILCFLLSLKRKSVFFLGIVPIDNDKGRHAIIWPDQVMFFNNHLHEVCKKYKFIYVDVFNALKDMTFEMADENSGDGLHIGALEKIYTLVEEHAREGKVLWRGGLWSARN